VVIVGRNPEKAEAAQARIAAAARHGGGVEVEIADLSLMEEIRRLADRLLSRPQIHVLVNNAGVLLPERRVTAEGNEATLATNLLGHFLLTNLLIPRLVESAPARIVNVTSGGMYTTRISVSNLQNEGEYDGRVAYARTKRGQVILTEMWADRLRGSGVVVHSMHPGWADTPGVESGIPLFQKVMRPLLRTSEQGADTIVWLAAAGEPGEESGLFWHDREPRPTHRASRTRETAEQRERLWRALSDLAGWDDPDA
jgi:NAD(P)-dependent dehydrogenase (short-subunit alcohol dehydrogenase family)